MVGSEAGGDDSGEEAPSISQYGALSLQQKLFALAIAMYLSQVTEELDLEFARTF